MPRTNDDDLGNSVHYHLARLGARWTGTSGTVRDINGPRDYIDSCLTSDRPNGRQTYAFSVMAGWVALVAVGTVGAILVSYLAVSVGGEAASRVIIALCGAGLLFCAAGILNAIWRAMWFTSKAQWHARRNGTADERFARAMRGILPRNSSLIGQSLVAVLTFVIILL